MFQESYNLGDIQCNELMYRVGSESGVRPAKGINGDICGMHQKWSKRQFTGSCPRWQARRGNWWGAHQQGCLLSWVCVHSSPIAAADATAGSGGGVQPSGNVITEYLTRAFMVSLSLPATWWIASANALKWWFLAAAAAAAETAEPARTKHAYRPTFSCRWLGRGPGWWTSQSLLNQGLRLPHMQVNTPRLWPGGYYGLRPGDMYSASNGVWSILVPSWTPVALGNCGESYT